MKEKTRRVGSFLCFGPPATDDEKNEKPAYDSPEADGNRKNRSRRLMSKILQSISFKSNSSNRGAKLPKDRTRWRLGKASDSSENKPSAFKSSGKNSGGTNFSSSSSSSSPSSSSSCVCCSAAAAPPSTTPAPRLRIRTKETFMPPPANRNSGRATGPSLVLLSMFAMLFCGRLCAILWTATWLWLCLWPRRGARRVPPEFADVAASSSSSKAAGSRRRAEYGEEEKKRVILDGFLRRNRKFV